MKCLWFCHSEPNNADNNKNKYILKIEDNLKKKQDLKNADKLKSDDKLENADGLNNKANLKHGSQILVEDNIWLKMTLYWRQLLMDD